MTPRLAPSLAALMLLLPAATALVPLPAAAQYGSPVTASAYIDSFELRGGRRIEPGEELRFRLRGAPYAQAWVDIPGVASGLVLSETRPGVYDGTYVVRQRDDPNAFARSVASLQTGNQRASAQVAIRGSDERPNRREDTAPVIYDVSPAQGAVLDDGRVRIAARVQDDDRRGLANDAVTLRLDGRDVTRDVRLNGNELEYRANLPRGRHTAELQVRDAAGHVTRRAWSFDVMERQARVTPGVPVIPQVIPVPRATVVVPAAGPVEIYSHAVDAEWDLRNPVPIRGRTFPLATVRLLIDAVADTGGGKTSVTVSDTTVRADAAGHFVIVPRMLPLLVAISPDFYQLRVLSSNGPQSAETQLRLRHRS